jgi:hypothetical protein
LLLSANMEAKIPAILVGNGNVTYWRHSLWPEKFRNEKLRRERVHYSKMFTLLSMVVSRAGIVAARRSARRNPFGVE